MKLNNLMESKKPDITNDPYTSSEWAIPEGQRNATMSHLEGKLIIRFGDTDEARNKLNEMATRCEPVLPDSELDSIWRSAQKFGRKVCSSKGYIPPEKYNGSLLLKHSDFSDTAQAEVFASIYNDRLAYTKGTGFLVYDGVVWEETKTKPREVYHEFSALQLREASIELADAKKRMEECSAWDMLETMSTKKALSEFNREQREAYYAHQLAKNYHTFALEERNTRNISAALKEIEPIVEVDVSVLDADLHLLNTPTCTINLAKGIDGVMEHSPSDMLTKGVQRYLLVWMVRKFGRMHLIYSSVMIQILLSMSRRLQALPLSAMSMWKLSSLRMVQARMVNRLFGTACFVSLVHMEKASLRMHLQSDARLTSRLILQRLEARDSLSLQSLKKVQGFQLPQ